LGLPAVRGLVSKRTAEDRQGAVQGAMTSLTTLTAVFGPLAATAAFGYFTGPHAPWRFPGVPFLLGALVYGVGAVVAWRSLDSPRLKASGFVAEALDERPVATGSPGPPAPG
jgi:DHA1 family tetracycline resistance protein-like MFS transporter